MKKVILPIFVILVTLMILADVVFASDVKISKETVKQGGFFEIFIEGVGYKDVFIVTFQKRKYLSSPGVSRESHRVVIPVHVFDSPGEAEITFESKYEISLPQKILIEKADFEESQKIDMVKPLSPTELKRYQKERDILNAIYRKTTRYPFFITIEEPFFGSPLEVQDKISSPFGFVRKRKVGKSEKIEKVPHGGTDFAVPNGTKVFASETGIVRLARELINSGNTVIIDHGYNIFSVYMHLSQVFVSEGDVVWRNDEIALSGDTGRVTGPHLHFGIKVWDTWVDPKYFLQSIGGNK